MSNPSSSGTNLLDLAGVSWIDGEITLPPGPVPAGFTTANEQPGFLVQVASLLGQWLLPQTGKQSADPFTGRQPQLLHQVFVRWPRGTEEDAIPHQVIPPAGAMLTVAGVRYPIVSAEPWQDQFIVLGVNAMARA